MRLDVVAGNGKSGNIELKLDKDVDHVMKKMLEKFQMSGIRTSYNGDSLQSNELCKS